MGDGKTAMNSKIIKESVSVDFYRGDPFSDNPTFSIQFENQKSIDALITVLGLAKVKLAEINVLKQISA